MRELLAWHYMEGIDHGDRLAAWLLEFGGWMPDPQLLYGDGTPMTNHLTRACTLPAWISNGPSQRPQICST